MEQSRRTVLVVEDHPPQLAALRRILSAMGLDVVAASDGAAAEELLAGLVPDLICLELLLPDTSGFELCEFIRGSQAHSAVPILVLSDRAYPADRAQALEVGADAFVAKPYLEDQLRARVESLLQAAASRPRLVGESCG